MQITQLPKSIPIFPLNGALLLPEGNLPLNIFEPRYISMIDYAMKNEKMIGMIQENLNSLETNNLYSTGCLGKINQYNETDDGRYLINLLGIIRFDYVKEDKIKREFRKLEVDYSKYESDLVNNYKDCFNKNEFLNHVGIYLKKNKIDVDWNLIKNVDHTVLITTLASICPFSIAEKQMILECGNTDEIPNIMLNLFKMNDGTIQNNKIN